MKKMVLNIIGVIFVIAVFWESSTNVYANAYNDNLTMIEPIIEAMEQRDSSYYPQIEEIMLKLSDEESRQGAVAIVESYNITDAYRVVLTESPLLTFLNEGNEFKDAASDIVQWKIPFVNTKGEMSLAVLSEKDGVLSYSGMYAGVDKEIENINMESIRKAVSDASEFDGKIDSMQIMHSYLYDTTFVYMDGEKSDYVILYSKYSKETGLENEKVYTVSEFVEQFNKCFDENSMMENPSHNGGVPFRTSALTIDKFIIGGMILVVGGVIVLFLYKKKSNNYLDIRNVKK